MKIPVSSFSSSWILVIFFLLHSCETTQERNAVNVLHHKTPVPCKGPKAIFPCGKTKAYDLKQKKAMLFARNAPRFSNQWKKTRSTHLVIETTRDHFSRVFAFPPWIIILPPLPSERYKTPFPYNKTWRILPTKETPFPFPGGRGITPNARVLSLGPWFRKKTIGPYTLEITGAPYAWDEDTGFNYDYNRHSDPYLDGVVIKALVIIGAVIILVLSYACVSYIKGNDCCSDCNSSIYDPILHSSPRSSTIIYGNQGRTATNRTHHNFSAPSNRTQFISTHTAQFATPSYGACATFSDKPPDYSAVVLDNFADVNKFPDVQSVNALDIPPPPYDEKAFHY